MVPFTNKVIENQLLAVFSKAGLCNVHQSKDAETSGITSGLLKILGTPKKLKSSSTQKLSISKLLVARKHESVSTCFPFPTVSKAVSALAGKEKALQLHRHLYNFHISK